MSQGGEIKKKRKENNIHETGLDETYKWKNDLVTYKVIRAGKRQDLRSIGYGQSGKKRMKEMCHTDREKVGISSVERNCQALGVLKGTC